jgi:Icc-related predicted phosphoesterase
MIMAGDLVPHMERGVRWLRQRVQDRPVIYIPGNHEFYGTDIDRTVEKARDAAAGTNIHVLQNDAVVIDNVKFVATTLWTDFAIFGDVERAMIVAGNGMNDFRRIRKDQYARRLRPIDTLARHQDSRKYLEAELSKQHWGPVVVVTHHGPDLMSAKPEHKADILTAAFVSDLTELITKTSPTLWVYGHTHRSDDRMIGSTRILSNAKGYGPYRSIGLAAWENPLFDPNLIATV